MKVIYYISSLRLPTERAYGINMVKTCEALALAGAEVILVAPRFRERYEQDLFDYYGVKRSFSARFYPFPDLVNLFFKIKKSFSSPLLFRVAFLFDQLIFSLIVLAIFLFRSRRCAIYTRSTLLVAWGLKLLGYRVCFDLHGFPFRLQWLWRRILPRLDGVTVTNQWKAERCERFFGIDRKKILIAPNGFDIEAFNRPINREEVKIRLTPGERRPIALYTGHFYDWKGAHIFAEAAVLLPEVNCIFIGGTEADQQKFRNLYHSSSNVIIFGRRPYREIADYLRSADVLVHPNPGVSREKRLSHFAIYDTSPIKLFEYLASGTPIVATDLPSAREVLNQQNSFLVKPNDPKALAEGIKRALAEPALSRQLAERARDKAARFSWSERGKNIFDFINRK